ncbi:MAG: 3-deoxy-D-manno-octulosonic acid transferase [Nitrospirota bacterium]
MDKRLIYFFYSLIQAILFFLFLIFSRTRRSHFASIRSRMGFFIFPKMRRPIWIHAVSVGEVLSVKRLISRIRQEFPDEPIVLSTITPTGQQVVRSPDYQTDALLFFPFDIGFCVNRFLNCVNPRMIVIAETEIWPHFLRACRLRNIPVLWVNGRISDQSYPRYLWIRGLLKRVLNRYTVIGMQTDVDRQRVIALGADPKKVLVMGNFKYDMPFLPVTLDPKLSAILSASDPLWIAASTMPSEEMMILDAYRKLIVRHPSLRLLIAPRHPERFDEVLSLIKKSGFSFARRSNLQGACQVILLDSLGELAATFSFARVVFVGGSLVPCGGHNILEPAFFSKPILFGPHMENFLEISERFLREKAAIVVGSPEALISEMDRVLSEKALASQLGENARKIVGENQGATEKTVSLIRVQMGGAPPGGE